MPVDTEEFLKGSIIDILIPQASDFKPEELDDHTNNAASSIETRSLLYFDESISAYIVLRTPRQPESDLEVYIARLVLKLEVQAHGFLPKPANGQDASGESSPARNEDTLWSGIVDTSTKPVITSLRQCETPSRREVLVIWRTDIPLSRPRMRLQSPMIAFKTTANLRPLKDESIDGSKNRYLPSGVPASLNLLESLKNDPAIQGATPKLSAARLARLDTMTDDPVGNTRPIKVDEFKVFRALPAVSSRVRYVRANGLAGRPSTIASLDIETAPFSAENVKLTVVDMELSDGWSEDIGLSPKPLLPLICRPKDNSVFLFRLTPYGNPFNGSNQTLAKTVLITVHATILVSPSCQPKIQMRWKTGVDFSTALNPMYGAPAQSMQRQRRPSSLSRAHSNTNLSGLPASNQEAFPTLRSAKTRRRVTSASDFGISMTITAPDTVIVGRPFSWHLLVLNRSSEKRQLALKVVARRNDGVYSDHLPKSSLFPASRAKVIVIADSVVDESSLYALHKSTGPIKEQVISLSTDLNTGLNPDSCTDIDLKLLALATGYVHFEALRVTDVASNESIELRDLPDIVVEDVC